MKSVPLQTELGTVSQVRTLFKPGSWLAKMDFINHLVLFNNVLITVLAEKSGGKTSFSALLSNNLDPQIKPVFIAIQPPCHSDEVLGDIAAQLHLNKDEHTDVHALVAQINERKAHVLVVIDDAHHLPESLIKEFMIAIRNQDHFGFFHLCFISDYSVVATLNYLAADQFNNLIHTIELSGLNENETRTYVLQRAMAARLINKPLTDQQARQFYQLTKGNIARINSNLDSFIFRCSTEKVASKFSLVKQVSLVASIVATAVASFFYFQSNYNTPQVAIVMKPLITSIPAILPAMSKVKVLTKVEPLLSDIPAWRDHAAIQLVHNALPKRQVLDPVEGDEEESPTTVALVDKVIVIPSIPVNELLHGSHALETDGKQTTPSKLLEASDTIAAVAHSAGYTIQLAASHNKDDVYRFQHSNALYVSTKVRHFTNAKGNWYILTLGEFDSRAQAQAKVSELPAAMTKLNPWVRPISGLADLG